MAHHLIIIIISILKPVFLLRGLGLSDKTSSKASSPLRTILRVSRLHSKLLSVIHQHFIPCFLWFTMSQQIDYLSWERELIILLLIICYFVHFCYSKWFLFLLVSEIGGAIFLWQSLDLPLYHTCKGVHELR